MLRCVAVGYCTGDGYFEALPLVDTEIETSHLETESVTQTRATQVQTPDLVCLQVGVPVNSRTKVFSSFGQVYGFFYRGLYS